MGIVAGTQAHPLAVLSHKDGATSPLYGIMRIASTPTTYLSSR